MHVFLLLIVYWLGDIIGSFWAILIGDAVLHNCLVLDKQIVKSISHNWIAELDQLKTSLANEYWFGKHQFLHKLVEFQEALGSQYCVQYIRLGITQCSITIYWVDFAVHRVSVQHCLNLGTSGTWSCGHARTYIMYILIAAHLLILVGNSRLLCII